MVVVVGLVVGRLVNGRLVVGLLRIGLLVIFGRGVALRVTGGRRVVCRGRNGLRLAVVLGCCVGLPLKFTRRVGVGLRVVRGRLVARGR